MSSSPAACLLTPTLGKREGGTAFAVICSNLTGASVSFGSASATGVSVHESGMVLAGLTPAHEAGSIEVRVITSDGDEVPLGEFTYE